MFPISSQKSAVWLDKINSSSSSSFSSNPSRASSSSASSASASSASLTSSLSPSPIEQLKQQHSRRHLHSNFNHHNHLHHNHHHNHNQHLFKRHSELAAAPRNSSKFSIIDYLTVSNFPGVGGCNCNSSNRSFTQGGLSNLTRRLSTRTDNSQSFSQRLSFSFRGVKNSANCNSADARQRKLKRVCSNSPASASAKQSSSILQDFKQEMTRWLRSLHQ